MLKHILSLFTIMLIFLGHSQGQGGLILKGFTNTTLNLNDNTQIDRIRVRIVNQLTREEKTVVFTNDIEQRPLLNAGEYHLYCSVKGEKEWVLNDISVTADKATLIELLYEPQQKLTRSQKRQRKKQGFIFER